MAPKKTSDPKPADDTDLATTMDTSSEETTQKFDEPSSGETGEAPKKYYATSLLRDGESIVQPGEEVTHVSGTALEELLARGAVELR